MITDFVLLDSIVHINLGIGCAMSVLIGSIGTAETVIQLNLSIKATIGSWPLGYYREVAFRKVYRKLTF